MTTDLFFIGKILSDSGDEELFVAVTVHFVYHSVTVSPFTLVLPE